MSNTNTTSEKLSFWQLIKRTKIEIPIIQRDYAQGREDKFEIRNRFLNALSNALIDNNSVELDFIYGTRKQDSLHPLDGQQRLTTLFLLHWYLSQKESSDHEDKTVLQNFTYETRTSSREFCSQLVGHGVDFKLVAQSKEKTKQLSNVIMDSSWFFHSWMRDPTISAMLIMLDAIHEKFANSIGAWSKLTKETRITFQYIELQNFGLTDDLYIKMNARGKALTDFENFKAEFEKYITQKKWEDESKREVETFSYKIDTVWTDLFWRHRDSDFKIDSSFIKFISGVAINLYAQNLNIVDDAEADRFAQSELEGKSKNKITREMIKRERIEKRIQFLFNAPENIQTTDFSDKEGFNYLLRCLNVYSDKVANYDTLRSRGLTLWEYCCDSTLFDELIKVNTEVTTSYKQRVLFYAQTEYLLNFEYLDVDFEDWMRVVRNIVHNSTIDSATTFIGAIGLINEISKGANNIYIYLSSKVVKSNFASTQVEEEILKAKIVSKNIEYRSAIFATEDTSFCEGRIGFALYCMDYKDGDVFDVEKLSSIKNAIVDYLGEEDISNRFRRGLLAIEDGQFYNYWGSWVYAVNARKRCLISNIADLKNFAYNDSFRHYLKQLLNRLKDVTLDEVLNKYTPLPGVPNWKKRLIKEPTLIDEYCQSHHIAIPDNEDCCYLLRVSKPRDAEACHKIR